MSFVNDKILPRHSRQLGLFLEQSFVGSDERVKLILAIDKRQIILDKSFTLIPLSSHFDCMNGGTPLFELGNPVSCRVCRAGLVRVYRTGVCLRQLVTH